MSATIHPLRRELTLAQALTVLEPAEPLHSLIGGLLGSGEPATFREAEKAAQTVEAAERAVASLVRSIEPRTARWHELMLVSEAVARHAARIESVTRALHPQAA